MKLKNIRASGKVMMSILRRHPIVFSVFLFVVTLLALYLARRPLLIASARFLTSTDPPEKAELLVVLSGDIDDRPTTAAQLLQAGLAPGVLLLRKELSPVEKAGLIPEMVVLSRQILTQDGIPSEMIHLAPTDGSRVTSTYDEAIATRAYCETNHVKSVIVLTSMFHTRRARWIFNTVFENSDISIRIMASPHWRFSEQNWWQSEQGLITYAVEYLKLVYYFYRY